MNSTQDKPGQRIMKLLKESDIPVIIFGAGVVGEALYHACVKKGIKVECFCDNNVNKAKSPLCCRPVLPAGDLKSKYKDALFLISAADIQDVLKQLGDLGYSQWHPASLLLKDFDLYQYSLSAPAEFVEYAVSTCILCQDSYLNQDKLFLRSVDLIITERCSLKCRDCSNLMQYYAKPVNCDTDKLMLEIERFCGMVDEINEFRVIGGEPLMNKDFYLIMRRLIEEPKARKIVVYTNGTIAPDQGQARLLKSKKVLFIITDYGKLSRKLGELVNLLKQNKIAYYAQKARGWTDCASLMEHHRSRQEQKEVFRNCCAKNTLTLSDGKLYRCPFSANSSRLKAVLDCESDYINILELAEIKDKASVKNKIKGFLMGKEFLRACDYCNGRPFTAAEITPAIQIARPLDYVIQNR